jgi:hypothetical protein
VEDEKTDRRPVIAAVVSSPRVFLSPRGSRELILAGILGPLPIGKPDLISCVRAGLLRVPFPWVLWLADRWALDSCPSVWACKPYLLFSGFCNPWDDKPAEFHI